MADRFVAVDRIGDVRRLLDRFTRPQGFRRRKDGILDGRIPCTAAERILQRKADLILRRIRIALEQGIRRHDLPGDAESTLDRAMLHEGFLERMQLHFLVHTLGETFNCRDGLSVRALGGIDARDHRLAIHEDGACTAFGFFTADLCPCEAESLAQEGGKCFIRPGFERMLLPVYSKSRFG